MAYKIKTSKEKQKGKYYVLTMGDDLLYFDSREEAERYVKNFPQGTYKIGET